MKNNNTVYFKTINYEYYKYIAVIQIEIYNLNDFGFFV